MTLAVDHVIAVVDDLGAAAAWLLDRHGLASAPGGRHPGHGTGNRIVPLGSSYLELMAVVDEQEAETSPLGRWALERASSHIEPAALCLRTNDIEPIARALGEEPVAMSRMTPTGAELSWHLVGLAGMLTQGHPFFIEWHCEPEDHPATTTVDHRADPVGVASIGLPATQAGLTELIATVPGVAIGSPNRLVIETESGSIELG